MTTHQKSLIIDKSFNSALKVAVSSYLNGKSNDEVLEDIIVTLCYYNGANNVTNEDGIKVYREFIQQLEIASF